MNNKGFLAATILVFCSLQMDSALAIKKCQDADGNWHYGDLASSKCKQSEVTTLTSRGFVSNQKKEKTAAEKLAEQQAREEAEEKERLQRQKEEDRIRILSVYETEEDINRQRDNQLNSVETNMAVHQTYINQMEVLIARMDERLQTARGSNKERLERNKAVSEQKIVDSKEEIKSLEMQKIEIVERFDRERELFRTLKKDADDA